MNNVLVTGGTGFIGSNLVAGLVEKGYNVSVFDNNFRGNVSNLEGIEDKINYIQGDIRNIDDVKQSLKGIDTVYHLAFINGTENFYNRPELVLEVGLKGHLNVMDAINETPSVKTLIYASSSEIYQVPTVIPTPEEVPGIVPDVQNPRYSYGGSKLMGEILTLHYSKRDDLKKVIFRPHNIYGGAMGFEHVLPQLVKKIMDASNQLESKDAEITIQGNGEETRAFCYISDAVDGIILSAEKGVDNGIYHVGKEEEVSIKDFIYLIAKHLGVSLTIHEGELQKGSTPRRCPDISKLEKLGFNPSVSLSDGLKVSVEWYKNYYLANTQVSK